MQPDSSLPCPSTPNLALQEHVRGAVAESFRMIKRPLLRKLRDDGIVNGNLIAVTSAMPAEGKSFCALHLAVSMAMERDTTVLLVDAHMAHPALPAMMGLPEGPGMLDLLLDDTVSVADVIVKTSLPALSVLPAGRCSRHAAELYASRDMGRLLDELASRYADRIIIFDTPPLLVSTEASVLAAQMGQVVLVVEADATPRSGLSDALRYLEPCEHIHLVYNKAPLPPPAYGGT
jgi:exopolysaccharide/PEP-CTERM locus tyrosine autokinase